MSFLIEEEKDQVKSIWTRWNSSSVHELEATFPTINDYVKWTNVVQYLTEIGLKPEIEPPKLNILLERNLRITIVGRGPIDEFCKTGMLKPGQYHALLKQRDKPVEGAPPDEVWWNEFSVKLKLRREIELSNDNPMVRAALSSWAASPKIFRYIERVSFQADGIRYDASKLHQSKKDTERKYIPVKHIKDARLFSTPVDYELEVEAIKNTDSTKKNSTVLQFVLGIQNILRGVQKSFTVLRNSTVHAVLRAISTLTEIPLYEKTKKLKQFVGTQPLTLMKENMAESKYAGTPNIRFDDYNVTDKADGDRCLLFIAENGAIYLIDKNQNVYGTDRRIDESLIRTWSGVLLDGEWVHQNEKSERVCHYYAFDIFNGKNGKDVSIYPFYSRESNVKMRLSELTEVIKLLTSDATLYTYPLTKEGKPTIYSDMSLKISVKQFQPVDDISDPFDIFHQAKTVLDRKNSPYHTDGLIFTPNNAALPKGGGKWIAQLKWKPAEENTIDFLVMTEMTEAGGSLERRTVRMKEDDAHLYKTFHLYVGSDSTMEAKDARAIILQQLPILEEERNKYHPKEFVSEPYDTHASICNIPIASDGSAYTTRTKESIQNRMIVEMAYHPEVTAGFRWEPIRIRWDKTAQYHEGRVGGTMNDDETAKSVWKSIHDPITRKMICDGILSSGTSTDITKVYYVSGRKNKSESFTKEMQEFHNYIKSELLLKPTLESFEKPLLLDMSCGRGGDINKWVKLKAGFVLGCDIAENAFTDIHDNIYNRYIRLIREKGGRDRIAPMIFVQADASVPYEDGTAGSTPEDRKILRTLYGHSESDAPPAVLEMAGIASGGFDVVAIMYSLHFMFRDRSMLDGWLLNVAASLKLNGYFIGCCFDGDTVANTLMKLSKGDTYEGKNEEGIVWTIRKQYDDGQTGSLPPTEEGIGQAIDVYFPSIGDTYTEYLVSFSYLQTRLQEIGCELVSTATYDEISKGRSYSMDASLRTYSNLHRYFLFKRTKLDVKSPRPATVLPSLSVRELEDTPAATLTVDETVDHELIDLASLEESSASAASVAEPGLELAPAAEPGLELAPAAEPGLELAPALVGGEPVVEAIVTSVKGPILRFHYGSPEKDDLKLKHKDWARYLSTYHWFPYQDRSNSSILYPSLEAAMAAEKFKSASNKPELGVTLFGSHGTLHQSYLAKKEEEEEGREIIKQSSVKEMQKKGALFDEAKWNSIKAPILQAYVQERFAKDEKFRTILEKVRETGTRLAFYTRGSSDLSGTIDGDRILGENLYGRALMALVGTTY